MDPKVKHITDAMCIECAYIFGRVDQVDELAGLSLEGTRSPTAPTLRHKVPVISDRMAAVAIARLQRDARELSALPGIEPPAFAIEALALLPPPPATPAAGLRSAPSAGQPLHGPADAGPRSPGAAQDSLRSPGAAPSAGRVDGFAAPRPAGVETVGGRAGDFMRHFKREREANGRS